MTAYVPSTPGGRPDRSRGSKILMAFGGVILAIGLAAIVIGVAILGDSTSDLDDRTDRVRSELLTEVDVPGRAEVRLDPGLHYVYAIGPEPSLPPGTTTSVLLDDTGTDTFDLSEPSVTVTGPDGEDIILDLPGPRSSFDPLSDDVDVIDEFRVAETGTYTVEATGGDAEQVGVGRSTDLSASIGKALGGGLLALVGFFVAPIGGALLLGGFIWFLVSKSASSTPQPSSWGPPPGAWGPPGAGPPGSWAPGPGPYPPPPPGGWTPPAPPSPLGWAPPPTPVPPAAERPPHEGGPVG